MKNRKLLLIISVVLALTMSLGGTLAYLTDTDADVNTMVLGNVKIAQNEQMRDENGELVLKKGEKQADSNKRDTEKIALDTDWKRYFQEEVLPHIDPESWVELGKTRKLYEINFTRYFYKFTEQEASEDIVQRIKERDVNITEMMKSIFED